MIRRYLTSVILINIVQFSSLSVMAFNLTSSAYGEFRVIYAFWLSAASIALLGLNQSLIKEYKSLQLQFASGVFKLINFLLVITSIITTIGVTYFLSKRYYIDNFLIVCLFFCIYGYAYFSLISSRLQAAGDDKSLLKVQTSSKLVVFIVAGVASFTLKIEIIFIGIAVSYFILGVYLYKGINIVNINSLNLNNSKLLYSLLKRSSWPWLMAIVAILSQHVEFLSSAALNLDVDSVGKLGYSNLIFMGLTAGFFAFQNYVLTRYSDSSLTFHKMGMIQNAAIGLMLAVCFFVYILVQYLHYFNDEKFDSLFIHYSFLMIVKSISWSFICIKGAMLYYFGHTVAAFLIGCLPLGAAIIASITFGAIDSIIYAQSGAYILSAIFINLILTERK